MFLLMLKQMRLRVKYLILLTQLLQLLLLLLNVKYLILVIFSQKKKKKEKRKRRKEKILTITQKFVKLKIKLLKNELNELSKRVKVISRKQLKKDLINSLVFLMAQNNFLQGYFKIFQYLYQLRNKLNILVILLGLI